MWYASSAYSQAPVVSPDAGAWLNSSYASLSAGASQFYNQVPAQTYFPSQEAALMNTPYGQTFGAMYMMAAQPLATPGYSSGFPVPVEIPQSQHTMQFAPMSSPESTVSNGVKTETTTATGWPEWIDPSRKAAKEEAKAPRQMAPPATQPQTNAGFAGSPKNENGGTSGTPSARVQSPGSTILPKTLVSPKWGPSPTKAKSDGRTGTRSGDPSPATHPKPPAKSPQGTLRRDSSAGGPSYDSDDEDNMVGLRLPKGAVCMFDTEDGNTLQPSAPPKKVGLDDFELIKVLGKGAFGKVWKVRRKGHAEYYAMKVMSKRHFWKQNLVELLKAEKTTMAKIKHPFIVSLRWAWQTIDRAFLVMDYMPGGELSTLLMSCPGNRFDEGRVRFYTAQIVLALEYLHSINIMYRDIKPDNFVLDEDGNAMLIDFGLAKPLTPLGKDGGANYFGQPNFYLSPEMLKGEPFGLEVDWWMLGVFVYQMLIGAFPWNGRNPAEVHMQVISPAPIYPPMGYCSADASDFITQILGKDLKRRLRTAAQVKAHPWLAGVPWEALKNRQCATPWKPPAPPQYEPAHPFQGAAALSYTPPPNQMVWLEGFSFAPAQHPSN